MGRAKLSTYLQKYPVVWHLYKYSNGIVIIKRFRNFAPISYA